MKRLIAGSLTALAMFGAPVGYEADTADAQSADLITVGPGTAILSPLPCTIATTGHDAAGNTVALTAGHCMLIPGSDVFVGPIKIGHYASWTSNWALLQSDSSTDWAIIQLDPDIRTDKMIPGGATITTLGTNPAAGPLTKFGTTTRTTQGTVNETTNNVIHATNTSLWGDSGGPAYIDHALVGLTSAIDLSSLSSGIDTLFSGIDGILSDLDSRPGIVGYGFSIG
ncbi:hypothetical protein AB0L57_32275 [Nocardia sp. NPDC052254]|uniref:hypothetical protein n=1 Tax=Nocardia sp. NPDC052254 TaxID=3155681 RepID=UPI00341513E7